MSQFPSPILHSPYLLHFCLASSRQVWDGILFCWLLHLRPLLLDCFGRIDEYFSAYWSRVFSRSFLASRIIIFISIFKIHEPTCRHLIKRLHLAVWWMTKRKRPRNFYCWILHFGRHFLATYGFSLRREPALITATSWILPGLYSRPMRSEGR